MPISLKDEPKVGTSAPPPAAVQRNQRRRMLIALALLLLALIVVLIKDSPFWFGPRATSEPATVEPSAPAPVTAVVTPSPAPGPLNEPSRSGVISIAG